MIEVKAPNKVDTRKVMLFLAGTIDNGDSPNWQKHPVDRLQMDLNDSVVAINPRREDWDSTWKQEYSDPKFKQQVGWELYHITMSEVVFFFIGKDSKSPISLMELGLCHRKRNVIVFCEEGFYRKGNVDAICCNYAIQQVDSWDKAVSAILWAVSDVSTCVY